MHLSSLQNMQNFIRNHLDPSAGLAILDIGSQDVSPSGKNSYKPLFFSDKWHYIGVDMVAGHNVDVVLANPYSWKEIKSSSVDVVVSGQAFEHIEFVWVTMLEVFRVLKPGGICCIVAPSNGRKHRYPLDCWRFYEDGMQALCRYAHLETVELYTQRDRFRHPGYDPEWQDTVLICKKPALHFFASCKESLRNYVSKKLVAPHVKKMPTPPATIDAQLFWALDGGNYAESASAWQTVENIDYRCYFDLPRGLSITGLRFDPATHPVDFTLKEAAFVDTTGGVHTLEVANTNAVASEGRRFIFNHSDPSIYFKFDSRSDGKAFEIDYLYITGDAQIKK